MITDQLSNEEYHASKAISSSDVKTVLKSSIYHWRNKSFKETPAMALGTAVHDMALEGGHNTVRGPETRRGSAWKDLEAQCRAEGKVLLPEKEYDTAENIVEAIMRDGPSQKVLTDDGTEFEKSIFATCPTTGLELRCRPDIMHRNKGVLGDIKTTVDASPEGFMRQIYNFRYDVQAAFYTYVCKLAGVKISHFAFLAAENTHPHAAHMHVMSLEAMEIGHKDMMFGLNKIAEAQKAEDYSTGWPRFTMIYPPAWMNTTE